MPMLTAYDTTRSNIGPLPENFDKVADALAREHADAIYSLASLNEANTIRRELRKLPENESTPVEPLPTPPLPEVSKALRPFRAGHTVTEMPVTDESCNCSIKENFEFSDFTSDKPKEQVAKYIVYLLIALVVILVIKKYYKR